ncbi:hypothetical protein Lser_V15G03296 [Lactuca serriola]
MVGNRVQVGPWGGNGGVNPWTFMPDGRIYKIRISAGACVDSIRFTYIDHDNVKHHSETYGGDGGGPYKFTLGDDENLIAISGTVGEFDSYTVIRSLSFVTNKKSHGPYGTNEGTGFSLRVSEGRFGGFSGNYGAYLDSLSVILNYSH